MKRVKVAPGKFVWISDELAAKAEKLGALTKAKTSALLPAEPKLASGRMLGNKLKFRRKPKQG